jgi:hypothetical protein
MWRAVPNTNNSWQLNRNEFPTHNNLRDILLVTYKHWITAKPPPQVINIQSTHRTAPDLYKNFSPVVSFGSNGNPYTVRTQSDMCLCISVCIYVSAYMCLYICVCIHVSIYILVCIYVSVYMCLYICACTHVCVYMCLYTCTYSSQYTNAGRWKE